MYLCVAKNTKIEMTEKKEETILTLVRDAEAQQLLEGICYNWEVASSCMERISNERQQGLYDDEGVEVLPVLCRMERVYTQLLSLAACPQAVLLRSFADRLRPLTEDQRMDVEATALLAAGGERMQIVPPTLWERLFSLSQSEKEPSELETVKDAVSDLYVDNILPHMDSEERKKTLRVLGSDKAMAEQAEQVEEMKTRLTELGKTLRTVARCSRQTMGVGLMIGHAWVAHIYDIVDIRQHDGADVSELFEEAKREVLQSERWRNYWANHKKHLSQLGKLPELLDKDAEETEQWLIGMHNYLYNKWNESPEAFGEALKTQMLTDEQLLMLLFHLAKKDAYAIETELPDERREKMEQGVYETLLKLNELVDDDYYMRYGMICQRIVKSEELAKQLLDFNSSKYNKGFSMLCLCKIIGYLNREYHLYGSHTPEDLGKVLGDCYVKNSFETIANYIMKKDSSLNGQCFKDLDEVMKIAKMNI